MIKFIKKHILLSIAALIAIYTIVCDFLMTFSLSMNVVLIIAVILLVMTNYIVNTKLDKELRGPSFPRILTVTVTIFFFSGIFIQNII